MSNSVQPQRRQPTGLPHPWDPPGKNTGVGCHSSGKESTCQCRRRRRRGFNPWVGKIPWRRSGNPLQYSCLEIPWTEEPGTLQSMGPQRVRSAWTQTKLLYVLGVSNVHFSTVWKVNRSKWKLYCCCCSVAPSCPAVCNPMDKKRAKLPWPPLSVGVCSDSCPLSWWSYLLLLPSAFPPKKLYSIFQSQMNVTPCHSGLKLRIYQKRHVPPSSFISAMPLPSFPPPTLSFLFLLFTF